MNHCAIDTIEESILRMTAKVRETLAHEVARSFGEDPAQDALGWWVLACGKTLDTEDFRGRDAVRDELRRQVADSGIVLAEHVWVWDEAGVAQLVVATLPSRERAERVAEKLRTKGLTIRVRPEKI